MCGIAGLIAARPVSEGEMALLEAMNATMLHRGPDSGGVFRDGEVAIAMRRLAIVDIAGGRQPLFSEDRAVTLVCNGEIYNHRDLRSELQAAGHILASGSDVETLIHAYEDDPAGFLARAKGMFALALWDSRRRRLLLARDRLGEKPLYIWRDIAPDGAPRLWFASELRAILKAIPRERRRPDPVAVNEFLTFQYVLDPRAPVEGLAMLPAAHLLELEPQRLDAAPRRWWSLTAIPSACSADPAALVVERFDEACRRMGTADVAVGVALSGGIDSSLVASVAASHYHDSLHCFSVGYAGRPPTDERGIAERFARANGLPFSEVELDLTEIVEDFPAMISAMDTPIGDIAAHGYYAVSRAARAAGVPVRLSGLGGDEVFWGYDWVRAAAAAQPGAAARAPLWRRLLGRTVAPPGADSIFGGHKELTADEALARRLARGHVPEGHWLQATRTPAEGARDIAVSAALNDSWLISNCLALADRLSMAWSIELRVPFLDIDLIEAVTALRQGGLGDHAWPHKGLLLQALGSRLPAEITERRKQGFTPPVQDWMRALDARWSEQALYDSAAARAGLLDGTEQVRLWPRLPIAMRHKLLVLDAWARGVLEAE